VLLLAEKPESGETMAEKRGPGRPPKNESVQEKEEREDLESIFSDLTTTYNVKVYRQEPEWCSGYMGQFHVGVGRTLSIEEIKHRYGGRVFELRVYTPLKGGIAKRTTIVIDDVPRRDGFEINRDGTTNKGGAQTEPAGKVEHEDPLDELLNLPLPPKLKRKLTLLQMGLDEPTEQKQAPVDTLQSQMQIQQMMMEMMNQSRQSQMQMAQQQFEMHKNMMQARQELEASAKPKDPMGDVNNVISLVREINGIKAELGGAENQGLASQVLEQTVPLVESALTEFLSYKKLQAQNELKRSQTIQNNAPVLPVRTAPAQTMPQIAPPSPASDPIRMAEQMAETYASLDPETQKAVMMAFVGRVEQKEADPPDENQNIVSNPGNDIIEGVDDSVLDAEDRAILDGYKNENEAGNVQNSEHAATIEENDPPDRQGDSSGFNVPTH
jgi:hypothetical protein